jgi:hypothetical protein
MEVDVIILSKTATEELFKILKETVNSLKKSEKNHSFNVIIVESNKKIKEQFGSRLYEIKAKFILPPVEKFNYNQFLNIGLRECKNDYILISNNDVIYFQDWFSEIKKQFDKDPELLSACPTDRKWHRHAKQFFDGTKEIYLGYRTSYEFTGWSFVVKKEVFKQIGVFDEKFDFYYQDNDWVEMYKRENIKHGLVYNSLCHHLLSKSTSVVDKSSKLTDMDHQYEKFFNKWTYPGEKKYKRLSILIPSLEGRESYLNRLVARLKPQVTPEVEILLLKDNKEMSIGEKRNKLIEQSIGEYTVFIDDDDWVSEDYVKSLLMATDHKPDVVSFNTCIINEGKMARKVDVSIKHEKYKDFAIKDKEDIKVVMYRRRPGHLHAIKRSIGTTIKFPHISIGEDEKYAKELLEKLKTEIKLNKYLYFYDNRKKDNSEAKLMEIMSNEKKYVESAEKIATIVK